MNNYSFRNFTSELPLLESVQQAKDYLLKRYALSKKIKTGEIPEDVKRRILEDPKFIEIKDLTAKNPGYTPMLVKFRYEQNASMESLEEIYSNLIKYKQTLNKDLPMDVSDYEKIEPTEDDIRPGYEVLGDDLRNVERKRKLKKLYDELVPSMKDQFRKATTKQLSDLEEISNQLDVLPDKVGEDIEGNPIILKAWKGFSKGMKKYSDVGTYPKYKDPKVAFGDILKDGLLFIETWKMDEDEFIKKLKDLGEQVGLLYTKNGYIAMSARTPEALRAVAGDTGWCIRDEGTFWRYGEGRIQLNIVNSNLPVTNDLSLIGITINPDGTIHTDATRPNQRLRDPKTGLIFKTYIDALDKLGYPNELIESVKKKFKSETDIKIALERLIFREGDSLSEKKILESLISMSKGVVSGLMTEEEWTRISGIVSKIVFEQKKMTVGAFMNVFKEHGILTQSTLNVFDSVVGSKYTNKDIEEIISSTEEAEEDMRYIMELYKKGDVKAKQGEVEKMEQVIKGKSNLIEKLKAKIK